MEQRVYHGTIDTIGLGVPVRFLHGKTASGHTVATDAW